MRQRREVDQINLVRLSKVVGLYYYYMSKQRPRPPLTSITVRLHAVAILQSVTPGALIPGRCVLALPDPVPAFEPVGPLSPVNPPPFGLYAESMAPALRPVAMEHVPAGPGVHADHFEAVRPGARVLALALGSRAHTVAVGFAVLPASAVCAAIVKVEPTARHSEGSWECYLRCYSEVQSVLGGGLESEAPVRRRALGTGVRERGVTAAAGRIGRAVRFLWAGWRRVRGGRSLRGWASDHSPHTEVCAKLPVVKLNKASCLTFKVNAGNLPTLPW